MLLAAACRWDSTRILLDPYAPLVKGRARFAQRDDFERFQTAVGSFHSPHLTSRVEPKIMKNMTVLSRTYQA